MAETLEDISEEDADRKNDERSFQKEKFDIFVEEYRESAEPRPGSSVHSDAPLDIALRKDVINMKRKMNRAKFAIQAMPDSELLNEYVSKIDSIIVELDELMLRPRDPSGEFTTYNIPLPYYDPTDMELLFGNDGPSQEAGNSSHCLSVFSRAQRDRVSELLGAASILLTEYDVINRQMRSAVLSRQ